MARLKPSTDCNLCEGGAQSVGNDCGRDPRKEFLEAIDQFNREEYFECHETLEDLWRAENGRIRGLYKGILQIGVGIYHARRSNLKGALRLISSGMKLTSQFTPYCLGIDVEHFLQMAGRMKEKLEKMESGGSLSPEFVPKIRRSV